MKELSVNIKICGRTYPMKVKKQDEARIRKVGQYINDRVKMYQDNFGIIDAQDLLAMVAFDSFVAMLKTEEEAQNANTSLNHKLHQLSQSIDKVLAT